MPEDSDFHICKLDGQENFKVIALSIKNVEATEISIKKHEPA
jgi:predicted nuclease of predicted toxin-antitoxin system